MPINSTFFTDNGQVTITAQNHSTCVSILNSPSVCAQRADNGHFLGGLPVSMLMYLITKQVNRQIADDLTLRPPRHGRPPLVILPVMRVPPPEEISPGIDSGTVCRPFPISAGLQLFHAAEGPLLAPDKNSCNVSRSPAQCRLLGGYPEGEVHAALHVTEGFQTPAVHAVGPVPGFSRLRYFSWLTLDASTNLAYRLQYRAIESLGSSTMSSPGYVGTYLTIPSGVAAEAK